MRDSALFRSAPPSLSSSSAAGASSAASTVFEVQVRKGVLGVQRELRWLFAAVLVRAVCDGVLLAGVQYGVTRCALDRVLVDKLMFSTIDGEMIGHRWYIVPYPYHHHMNTQHSHVRNGKRLTQLGVPA